MDRLGEFPSIVEVGGLGLHPQQIAEGSHRQGFGHRVGDTALHLVVPLGGPGHLGIPGHVEAHLGGCISGGFGVQRAGEAKPLPHLHAEALPL